jgi:hypothetical protein
MQNGKMSNNNSIFTTIIIIIIIVDPSLSHKNSATTGSKTEKSHTVPDGSVAIFETNENQHTTSVRTRRW